MLQLSKEDIEAIADAVAARSRHASGAQPDSACDEIGWLVEITGPRYWTGTPGCGNWTADSLAAMRFARRQDAEAACRHLAPSGAIPVEHAWVSHRPAGAQPSGAPAKWRVEVVHGRARVIVDASGDSGEQSFWINDADTDDEPGHAEFHARMLRIAIGRILGAPAPAPLGTLPAFHTLEECREVFRRVTKRGPCLSSEDLHGIAAIRDFLTLTPEQFRENWGQQEDAPASAQGEIAKSAPNERTHSMSDAGDACGCRACNPSLVGVRMIWCETCGNKRCPHANDHRNTCTNSNEPGQPGSAYPAWKPASAQGEVCEKPDAASPVKPCPDVPFGSLGNDVEETLDALLGFGRSARMVERAQLRNEIAGLLARRTPAPSPAGDPGDWTCRCGRHVSWPGLVCAACGHEHPWKPAPSPATGESASPPSEQTAKELDELLAVFAKGDGDDEDCWTQPARRAQLYVASLRAEVERLEKRVTNLLSGTVESFEDGTLTILPHREMTTRIASALAGILDECEAPNYVQMILSRAGEPGEPRKRYVVTVQRPEGKTPHQLREDAEKERDAIRQEVDRLRTEHARLVAVINDDGSLENIDDIVSIAEDAMHAYNVQSKLIEEVERLRALMKTIRSNDRSEKYEIGEPRRDGETPISGARFQTPREIVDMEEQRAANALRTALGAKETK